MLSLDIKLDQLCNELFTSVETSIQNKQLRALAQEETWILSFSGGADSVLTLLFLVLLHKSSVEDNSDALTISSQRHLILYYLDHEQVICASEREKKDFVFEQYKKLLKSISSLKVDWIEKKKPVSKIAKKLKSSFERTGSCMRRKDLRYLSEQFYGKLILGHHLSDWYETLIMRLNRGSSLSKLLPFQFQNIFLKRATIILFFLISDMKYEIF